LPDLLFVLLCLTRAPVICRLHDNREVKEGREAKVETREGREFKEADEKNGV